MYACVRACACSTFIWCVRACVRARGRACVRVQERERERQTDRQTDRGRERERERARERENARPERCRIEGSQPRTIHRSSLHCPSKFWPCMHQGAQSMGRERRKGERAGGGVSWEQVCESRSSILPDVFFVFFVRTLSDGDGNYAYHARCWWILAPDSASATQ